MWNYADRSLLPGQPDGAYLEALRPAAGRLEELTPLAKTWDYDASALETLLRHSRATFSITLVVKLLPPHFESQTSIQNCSKTRVIEEDFESGETLRKNRFMRNDQIAGECSCHHEQKNNSLA
jgi:hypothetical protein